MSGLTTIAVEAVATGVVAGMAAAAAAPSTAARFRASGSQYGAQAVTAIAAGLLGWVITGWVAAGAWAAIGGWSVPELIRRDRRRAQQTDELDAWATWIALISGQLAGQASLAEAVVIACQRAPAALVQEITPLAEALVRLPLDEALNAWVATHAESEELRQVGLVLGLAASGSGGHVGDVLAQLGSQLRGRAASARRIERERRRVRVAGRAAACVAIAWVVLGARFDASLFGVYDSLAGQLLLAALLGLVAGGLWGLTRLDRGMA